MSAFAGVAALAIGAAAAVAALLTLAVTRRPALAMGVLLDLLLAAGLLRLTGAPGWGSITAVAGLVGLRQVLAAHPSRAQENRAL